MGYPTYDYSFEQYSADVKGTAQYPLVGNNMVYPAMGVCGEAGELLDKIKKSWRNKSKDTTSPFEILRNMSSGTIGAEERAEIIKEVGDVLWYLNAVCYELGVTLEHA